MRKILLGMGIAVSVALLPAVWAETTTKTPFKGNQLTGKYVPKTQQPAAQVGPAAGISAAPGGTLLALQKGSVLYLAGDSTLHKFEMGATALQGSAALKSPEPEKAVKAGAVGAMSLIVPVKSLKSKEKGLDENAYKALKADAIPEIKFILKKAVPAADGKSLKAEGTLSVAGTTAPVVLNAEVFFKDGQVRLKGVQKLKMTDFKVQPPSISLLVASIDCKDDVEIHYDVIFGKK
jgi:hypothetical protein